MCRLDKLHRMRSEIYRIVRRHNARRVYVFGSCARKEETPESDIDILIEPTAEATLFDFMDIQDELEKLLKCKVDVVSERGLHPYIREDILKEAVAL